MFIKTVLCVAICGAMSVLAPSSFAGSLVHNRAVEIVGAGAASDPLIAVEANRNAIVNRLVAEHAATLPGIGGSVEAFRRALESLRADQLLAASPVSSVAEITAIVSEAPVNGSVLQRFVALTPRDTSAMGDLPGADAYLVREGDVLMIVRAVELQSAMQVVGYFASVTHTVVVNSTARDVQPKDGSGSGPNSWIGYVAGSNQATGSGSAVAAGTFNLANAQGAFVGAGTSNQANGISSLVIGGFDNRAVAIDSLVGAGAGNRATGARSVIVGGGYNLASGSFSFIGGGGRDGIGSTPAGTDVDHDNRAFGKWSVIGGGAGNVAGVSGLGDSTIASTVGGGLRNTASGSVAAVAGGTGNTASGTYSTVGGGGGNTASGASSTLGGGETNTASGNSSAVVGGNFNIAGGYSASIAGGIDNTASGYAATVAGGDSNTASGFFATVAGGANNTAGGSYSFAAGHGAIAGGHGSFAIADSCCGTLSFPVPFANSFGARYTGGFTFASSVNPTTGLYATGCQLFGGGGSWACSSDRDTKTAFDVIDSRSILQNVVDMPVTRWRFQGEAESVRHIGPMAQDFRAAFGLGHDDKSISMLDAQGVALAAIQGMHQLMQENMRKKDTEIGILKQEMAELRRSVQLVLSRASVE